MGTQEVEESIKRKVGHHKDKEEHQRSASEREKGCRKLTGHQREKTASRKRRAPHGRHQKERRAPEE